MVLAVALGLLTSAEPAHLAVIRKYECHRCHEVEGVAAPSETKQCAGCHERLSNARSRPGAVKEGTERYGAAFERFIDRTARCYVDLPPLVGLSRFRASWLRAYLADPDDLRPHLAESMPRLPIAPQEVESLVKGFKLSADRAVTPPPAERVARGRALFESKGCVSCHLFGNVRFPSQPPAIVEFSRPATSILARAPDLRHVRRRLNRDVLVKLLLDPRSVNPRAQMPAFGLTRLEADALADFLLAADPSAEARPLTEGVAAKPSKVTYEEVEARVFKRTCWHCHSNADFADGDGGPGNTGGFGFKGAGLSFATYEEVMNGSVGPDGAYRSIFRLGATGKPMLLEVLERRVEENRRDFVRPLQVRAQAVAASPVLGMPLGLPALEPDDLALVEAWIAAGKPRPSTPAGTMLTPMGQ